MRGKWILIGILTIVLAFSLGTLQSTYAATVSGVVVDADEEAVAGARVMLMGEWERGNWGERPFNGRAETGENGEFSFEDVPDGNYRTMVMTFELGMAHGELAVEGDVDGLVIQLPGRQGGGEDDEGNLTVTLVDVDGEPVADAYVSLRMAGRWGRGNRGNTNEEGVATFEGVAAGEYRVFAMARGAGYAHGEIEVIADQDNEIELQLEGMGEWNFRRGGE